MIKSVMLDSLSEDSDSSGSYCCYREDDPNSFSFILRNVSIVCELLIVTEDGASIILLEAFLII